MSEDGDEKRGRHKVVKKEIDKDVVYDEFVIPCFEQRFTELAEKMKIDTVTKIKTTNEPSVGSKRKG